MTRSHSSSGRVNKELLFKRRADATVATKAPLDLGGQKSLMQAMNLLNVFK